MKPIVGIMPLWDDEKESIWMLPEYLVEYTCRFSVSKTETNPEGSTVLYSYHAEKTAFRQLEESFSIMDHDSGFYTEIQMDAQGSLVENPSADEMEQELLQRYLAECGELALDMREKAKIYFGWE